MEQKHTVPPAVPSPSTFRVFILFLLLALGLCAPAWVQASETAKQPRQYTLGTFPFLAKPLLEGVFAPIAAELATALGRPVHFQSASNFDKHTSNLEQQQYDIAHLHPFQYVITGKKAGYIPLVSRTEMLSALFTVKTDSPLKSPADLKGKTVGLPPKDSTISYLAKVALRQAGIRTGKDVTIKYFNTHQSCMQQLLIGSVDTCAVSPPILRLFKDQSKQSFRTILTSPEIPPTLFAVHRRVPPADREIIRTTLVSTTLSTVEPAAREIFIKGGQGHGGYFRPASDKDYNTVRSYLRLIGNQ